LTVASPLRRRAPAAPARPPRTGIIDIGSNSVRLVVYGGPARLPATLFNEKVLAGLGRGLTATGAIDPAALKVATTALARFAALAREMEVTRLRTVATAAVRDAANGGELIEAARALGLDVELLSGEQEASAAGMGVLSAIPQADGIVGDLGGGSLELVRVRGGAVEDRVSLPLGVLRIAGLRDKPGKLQRHVARLVRAAGWAGRGAGLPLYLVGGSWRGLARLDMSATGYPLPIVHGYRMDADTVEHLTRSIARTDKAQLRKVPGLSGGRAATLADAAALLRVVLSQLGAGTTITSAFGLREGLLFADLDGETRSLDPLIVAAREEGRLLGRFGGAGETPGDLLDRWIAPLFASEAASLARLRHAACLLADVGWHANPDFRAERGLEIALHGNWVAIDAGGRAMLAQALFAGLGGGTAPVPMLARLAGEAPLRTATGWGLAIRLGQRLSGGSGGPLRRSRLSDDGTALALHLSADDRALYGETVERRHQSLATLLGRKAALG
jgi:exopolyphosphatase/guanosine-5'-triphosphate,3'-diphosphate pyrophosphatase